MPWVLPVQVLLVPSERKAFMKHIKSLTIQKSAIPEKAQSDAGSIFLQVWAYVFGSILLGALGLK